MILVRTLYWADFCIPLCKSSTVDWSREKAKMLKTIQRKLQDINTIYNVPAVPPSSAVRKLCEAEVLLIHRKTAMCHCVNLWTGSWFAFTTTENCTKDLSFTQGESFPLHLHSTTELWEIFQALQVHKGRNWWRRIRMQSFVERGLWHHQALCVHEYEQGETGHTWYSNSVAWLNRTNIKF